MMRRDGGAEILSQSSVFFRRVLVRSAKNSGLQTVVYFNVRLYFLLPKPTKTQPSISEHTMYSGLCGISYVGYYTESRASKCCPDLPCPASRPILCCWLALLARTRLVSLRSLVYLWLSPMGISSTVPFPSLLCSLQHPCGL